MWDARSQYLANHDGDTVTYLSDLGRWVRHQADIRLENVFAPELSQPGGADVADFVTHWHLTRMSNFHWPFLVTTSLVRAKTPDVSESKLSLARFVGQVTCIATGESLNQAVNDFVAANGYVRGTGG